MKSPVINRALAMLWMLAFALPAAAVELEGVKLDDTVRVAGKDLKLNGAGVRTRVIFKVYALGLYLQDKKKTPADVLAADGPRRFTLVMLRDVSGADMSEAFMTALNKNSEEAEKGKIASQIGQFGEMFSKIDTLKKGGVVTGDWVPGSGTVIQLNGKPLADPLPDVAFYNAILKIWLGDKPADTSLKPALLGEKP